jgi:DNA-binding transcriptional LysR family regulator
MIDFTSRQLRAFLLVAEHRSFSRAAGALFITPSGVSLLIRELESQLATRLFDRTTRRVSLTTSGNEFLAIAQRSLRDLDGAISAMGRSAPEASQLVAVGAPPLVATTMLAPAIREHRLHAPNVRFQVFDGDSATTMRKVESGELDIGLGVFFNHLPGIRRTLLFRFPLILIRADEGQVARRSTTWSALKGENLISLPPSLPFQQFIDGQVARAGVVCLPILTVNYISTQIAMVEAGEGIAVIPSFGVLACQDRKVAMSRLINPAVSVDFQQIRHAGKKLSPAANGFASFFQHYVLQWAEHSDIR